MSPEQALHHLLCSLFDAAHLRRFLRFGEHGDALVRALPGDKASLAELMDGAVGELVKRGLVAATWGRLRTEHPRRQADIDRVAALWPNDSSGMTASAPDPHADATLTPPLPHRDPDIVAEPTLSNERSADVAILIALREEWEVFWPIAGNPRGVKDMGSSRYLYRFEVPSTVGRSYRCVALCMGDMGPGQATDATHLLLQARPRTIVNLGIAAAIHDDLRLCDVVVADQVDDYFATVKAAAEGKDAYAFTLRGSVYKSTYSLVQDVDNLKYAHPEAFYAWRSACAAAMAEHSGKLTKSRATGHLREWPELMRVHLASGPVLAAAEAFSQWIRTRDDLVKALEMEAAGMMLAAHQRNDPTSTLVLRGISDFGDRRKSKTDRTSGGAFRHLAMVYATELLWALMRGGILPRHGAPTPEFMTLVVTNRDLGFMKPFTVRTTATAGELIARISNKVGKEVPAEYFTAEFQLLHRDHALDMNTRFCDVGIEDGHTLHISAQITAHIRGVVVGERKLNFSDKTGLLDADDQQMIIENELFDMLQDSDF